MIHLAVNVYHWGDRPQDRLLADCLGPVARELWDEGLARRFWLHRFDARGPHLFALLSAPEEAEDEVRARLTARLESYLAGHPSTEALAEEELQRRHDGCRGGRLCAMDGEPGIAPNNSFLVAEHGPRRYPFGLSAGMAAEDELWRLLGELAFWSVDQVRAGATTAPAVRWIAGVDGALVRRGENAADYWRHYATTLLLPLAERLRTEEAEVLAALPGTVGERNRAAFARAWDAVESGAPAWSGTERLVELVAADDGRTRAQRLALLREINHCVLAQLGQPTLLRIPLALYAWSRNLPQHAAVA